jgi:hypothetical protein
VVVRYARWDLGRVDLVDPQTGTILAPLYPLDRVANADGHRKAVESPDAGQESENRRARKALPPLLQRILDEYAASGLPPAYLPQPPQPKKDNDQTEHGEES